MAQKKVKFVAGFSVIVICLLYLVVSGFQQTAMYYFTVTELEARETEFVGKRIKLAGKVVPGSIQKKGGREIQFQIWEPLEENAETFSEKRSVRYSGVVPDTFRDKSDVVLEGKTGADGVFEAETLLAKCPSKYEAQSYNEMKESHGQQESGSY